MDKQWRIAWYNYAVGVLRTKGYSDGEIEDWFEQKIALEGHRDIVIPTLADQEPFVIHDRRIE